MIKDLSFIGRPHEYDARRAYSLTGVDWQEKVNFDRLRRDRLARAKEQMEIQDGDELEGLAKEIRAMDQKALVQRVDVTKASEIQAMVDAWLTLCWQRSAKLTSSPTMLASTSTSLRST